MALGEAYREGVCEDPSAGRPHDGHREEREGAVGRGEDREEKGESGAKEGKSVAGQRGEGNRSKG